MRARPDAHHACLIGRLWVELDEQLCGVGREASIQDHGCVQPTECEGHTSALAEVEAAIERHGHGLRACLPPRCVAHEHRVCVPDRRHRLHLGSKAAAERRLGRRIDSRETFEAHAEYRHCGAALGGAVCWLNGADNGRGEEGELDPVIRPAAFRAVAQRDLDL